MVDPISDMLNRIRNAQAVLKETVDVPFSDFKYGIAKILEKQGFIKKAEKQGRKTKKMIKIILKYELVDDGQRPVISGLKRISKPGQRIYSRAKKIKMIRRDYGMAIISTPKGLMTDKEARKQRLGGEVICEIW